MTLRRALALAILLASASWPGKPLHGQPPRLEFTRLLAHWDGYATADYLPFIEAAQPEIAQVGFYGAHFWSLAHTEAGSGYPAHFPVVGLRECGDWFTELNSRLHRRGVKVVGHFNVKFIVGDPAGPTGPRGFFKYYHDLWDEAQLGKRPAADPLDLLEKKADGSPITQPGYGIGGMREYWGCLNNPAWRSVLKAWTKVAIGRGVDGLISNYFYRHDCTCEHCRREFKAYLGKRFTTAQLRERFGIADLGSHRFTEIIAWHNPRQSTPLRREMLRFSQISNKRALDEVLLDYGRSIKPDLIVAQWNHLGDFNQIAGDERCLLPAELWGRGEDYLWYSTGDAAYFTDLEAGVLGEGTLHARYIRGAFDDKPFTLGKYESTRARVTIAELAANGGAPMGFYARFEDPQARAEIVRYYQFLKRYESLYRGNRPHAEVLLLFPRSRVHEGDVAAVEQFKVLGRALLDQHVLFDVLPDDLLGAVQPKRYQHVVMVGRPLLNLQSDLRISRLTAPKTVRASVSRPATAGELDLHLVNYNRHEPAQKRSAGNGIADERPIATPDIRVDLQLPADFHAARVELLTPELSEPQALWFEVREARLRTTVPSFLVYAVVRVVSKEGK